MPRKTIAQLEAEIEVLLERLVEADDVATRIRFEADDWNRSYREKRDLLIRADAEISFLRSIVHGLVPESLQVGGGR